MPDRMPRSTVAALKLIASAQTEQCGFIMEDWSIRPISNAIPYPANKSSFALDQDEQRAFVQDEENRSTIIGVYHTHPSGNPRPSIVDIKGWPNHNGVHSRYWIATANGVYEWGKTATSVQGEHLAKLVNCSVVLP